MCALHVEEAQMTAELADMKSLTLAELAKKPDPELEKQRAEINAAERACTDKIK